MKHIVGLTSLLTVSFLISGCSNFVDNTRQTLGMDINASPTQVEKFKGSKVSSGDNPFRPKPPEIIEEFSSDDGVAISNPVENEENLSAGQKFKRATALVKKRDKSGAKIMQSLADDNYTPALYNLGVMNLTGQTIPKNASKGVSYLRKAADRGHVQAASTIGAMYLQGKNVSRNTAQARRYLTKAAQKADIQSMLYLSLMYNRGDGVRQDKVKAYQWLLSIPDAKSDPQFNKNKERLAKSLTPAQQNKAKAAAESFKSRYGIR